MIATAVSIVAMLFGGLLIICGLWPASLIRSGVLAVGILFMGGGGIGYYNYAPSSPSPSPTPPGPSPVVPVGQFAERVRQSFTGPKSEGQIVGALFDGLGFAIDNDGAIDANLDGKIDPPVFTDTRKLGLALSGIQKSRVGNVTPWGNKYPQFEATVVQEMAGRGLDISATKPVDVNAKSQFASLCHEVGAAFAE